MQRYSEGMVTVLRAQKTPRLVVGEGRYSCRVSGFSRSWQQNLRAARSQVFF